MRCAVLGSVVAFAVLAAGCTCGVAAEDDAGEDAGPHDAGVDGGLDAGIDGGHDAGIDAGHDAGTVDAGPDEENDSGCPHRVQSGSESVTYQIDVAHTGQQPNDRLTVPLCSRWQHDFGAAPGYPVVAGGRVFVITHTTGAGYGVLLWALDQKTGTLDWGPIDLGGLYWWGALAYDDGRVFAVNASAQLQAFDAPTGAPLWNLALPGQYSCDSPPTASGGSVFTGAAGSAGTVYSIDEADGGVRWTAPVANGDTSSPALVGGAVYVSYACNQAYGFSAADGGLLWHHSGTCEGGGGKNVAAYHGLLFTRDFDGNLKLDLSTGTETTAYVSKFIPTFSGDTALYTPGVLQTFSLSTGAAGWTLGGIGTWVAPIVVGPHVVTADDNQIYVVELADGGVLSSYPVPNLLGPDEQNVSNPLAGFAAADGMLFVPAGNAIVAF